MTDRPAAPISQNVSTSEAASEPLAGSFPGPDAERPAPPSSWIAGLVDALPWEVTGNRAWRVDAFLDAAGRARNHGHGRPIQHRVVNLDGALSGIALVHPDQHLPGRINPRGQAPDLIITQASASALTEAICVLHELYHVLHPTLPDLDPDAGPLLTSLLVPDVPEEILTSLLVLRGHHYSPAVEDAANAFALAACTRVAQLMLITHYPGPDRRSPDRRRRSQIDRVHANLGDAW